MKALKYYTTDKVKPEAILVSAVLINKLGYHDNLPLLDVIGYSVRHTLADCMEHVARFVFSEYLMEHAPEYAKLILSGDASIDMGDLASGKTQFVVRDRAFAAYIVPIRSVTAVMAP